MIKSFDFQHSWLYDNKDLNKTLSFQDRVKCINWTFGYNFRIYENLEEYHKILRQLNLIGVFNKGKFLERIRNYKINELQKEIETLQNYNINNI